VRDLTKELDDLLDYFSGTAGAVCPWPSRAEEEAELREFFGGEKLTQCEITEILAAEEIFNSCEL